MRRRYTNTHLALNRYLSVLRQVAQTLQAAHVLLIVFHDNVSLAILVVTETNKDDIALEARS